MYIKKLINILGYTVVTTLLMFVLPVSLGYVFLGPLIGYIGPELFLDGSILILFISLTIFSYFYRSWKQTGILFVAILTLSFSLSYAMGTGPLRLIYLVYSQTPLYQQSEEVQVTKWIKNLRDANIDSSEFCLDSWDMYDGKYGPLLRWKGTIHIPRGFFRVLPLIKYGDNKNSSVFGANITLISGKPTEESYHVNLNSENTRNYPFLVSLSPVNDSMSLVNAKYEQGADFNTQIKMIFSLECVGQEACMNEAASAFVIRQKREVQPQSFFLEKEVPYEITKFIKDLILLVASENVAVEDGRTSENERFSNNPKIQKFLKDSKEEPKLKSFQCK